MTAFTYECDLDHPVSAEVEKTIRDVLKELLSSQGLEGVLVNPGLDHDGDPFAMPLLPVAITSWAFSMTPCPQAPW